MLLDISPRTISKLENGQAELTIKHREKYLELFSKHPDGKSLLYYADDQLSEAFAKNIDIGSDSRSFSKLIEVLFADKSVTSI